MSIKNQPRKDTQMDQYTRMIVCLEKFFLFLLPGHRKNKKSIDEIMGQLLDIIPTAFKYPEKIGVMIKLNSHVYQKENFKSSQVLLFHSIKKFDEPMGQICVYYRPLNNESNINKIKLEFSKEEEYFVILLANLLGSAIEHLKKEKKISFKEELYQSIIEKSKTAIYTIDSQGIIVQWNKMAEKIFLYSQDEVLGKPLLSTIPPSLEDLYHLIVNKFTEGSNKFQDFSLKVIAQKKNGEKIPLIFDINSNKIGNDLLLTAYIKENVLQNDLLNKKRTCQLEGFYSLFNESMDTIYFSTPAGKFLDINPAGLKLFGYNSKEEMLKINIGKDIYINPNDRIRFKNEVAEKGFVHEFEVDMKKRDGSKITVLMSSHAIKDDSGNITTYRGIIRDITQQIENERTLLSTTCELLETNQKLKAAQATLFQQEKLASIGQLAAGVAHEINNPLAFVSSNFTTLKKYIQAIKNYIFKIGEACNFMLEDDHLNMKIALQQIKNLKKDFKIDFIMEDLDEMFKESHDGISRISRIVENLRSFSRIDREGKIEKLDLNEAIKKTLTIAQNELKYVANVTTRLTEIPLVECMGGEINQVFLNIIVNAAQAIGTQQREEKGNIFITTYQEKEWVCIEIKDDGPGIPQEHLNKIFDPFFTTKEVGKGTGLGLNIAHDIIVNKHQGWLNVKSKLGKGASFFIQLPINMKKKNKENESKTNNAQ